MKLAFAVLADSAEVSAEGKVSIGGGGVDTVRTPGFPSVHPLLVLAVQLISEPSDKGTQGQTLTLEGTTPSNDTWFQAKSGPISWHDPDTSGRPAKYNFIVRLPMLLLPTEGRYTIRLLLGDKELAVFPLWADLVARSDSGTNSETRGQDSA
jgi:hypothetical protein